MKILVLYGMLFVGILSQHVSASNLDGTSSIVYKNQHHVFYDGEIAQGFVRLNGGFTVLPGATATLDVVTSVSGPIDFRNNATLELLTDLKLDAGVTLSISNIGFVNGRGSAIILNDTLVIPASRKMTFTGDTIVDGRGHLILLEEHAQLGIDDNITVTFRNCTIKTTRYNPALAGSAPIRSATAFSSGTGRVAFDNVSLHLGLNFQIFALQYFFHNTVKITGTSSLIYSSTFLPSYIAPDSTLYFDKRTSFTYAPRLSSDNTLLRMQSKTSKLHFNGANFSSTSTGIRLTKGTVIFENKVNINSNTNNGFQVPSNSIIFGNSAVGASENVDVEIFGAAHVTINGIVNDDSV